MFLPSQSSFLPSMHACSAPIAFTTHDSCHCTMCTQLQTCMQAFLPPKSSSDNGNCTDLDPHIFKSCWAVHTPDAKEEESFPSCCTFIAHRTCHIPSPPTFTAAACLLA